MISKIIIIALILLTTLPSADARSRDIGDGPVKPAGVTYFCSSLTAFEPGLSFRSSFAAAQMHAYPAKFGNLVLRSNGEYYFTGLPALNGQWSRSGGTVIFTGGALADYESVYRQRQVSVAGRGAAIESFDFKERAPGGYVFSCSARVGS